MIAAGHRLHEGSTGATDGAPRIRSAPVQAGGSSVLAEGDPFGLTAAKTPPHARRKCGIHATPTLSGLGTC